MGVEFCIWLWRMYRIKQKQERLGLSKSEHPMREALTVPQKQRTVEDARPVR
jgi:hypothetical protein